MRAARQGWRTRNQRRDVFRSPNRQWVQELSSNTQSNADNPHYVNLKVGYSRGARIHLLVVLPHSQARRDAPDPPPASISTRANRDDHSSSSRYDTVRAP